MNDVQATKGFPQIRQKDMDDYGAQHNRYDEGGNISQLCFVCTAF